MNPPSSPAHVQCVGGPLCGDELEAIDELNRYPVWCVPRPRTERELNMYRHQMEIPNMADDQLFARGCTQAAWNKGLLSTADKLQPLGGLSNREQAAYELEPAYIPYCHPEAPPGAIGAYLPVVRVTRAGTWHAMGFHRMTETLSDG